VALYTDGFVCIYVWHGGSELSDAVSNICGQFCSHFLISLGENCQLAARLWQLQLHYPPAAAPPIRSTPSHGHRYMLHLTPIYTGTLGNVFHMEGAKMTCDDNLMRHQVGEKIHIYICMYVL